VIPVYAGWPEVTGYFDGDGCVGFRIEKYVIRFQLTWTDNSFAQVKQVREFLLAHKIEVGRIVDSEGWRLEIGAQSAVLRAASEMLRFSAKKHEPNTVVEHLRNRISGSEAIERLNEATRSGNREGKLRQVQIPWTRIDGKSLEHRIAVERVTAKNKVLTSGIIRMIIAQYRPYHVTQAELAERFGISRSSVERVLKDRA